MCILTTIKKALLPKMPWLCPVSFPVHEEDVLSPLAALYCAGIRGATIGYTGEYWIPAPFPPPLPPTTTFSAASSAAISDASTTNRIRLESGRSIAGAVARNARTHSDAQVVHRQAGDIADRWPDVRCRRLGAAGGGVYGEGHPHQSGNRDGSGAGQDTFRQGGNTPGSDPETHHPHEEMTCAVVGLSPRV
jgi:hypothetical protein